MTRVLFLGDTHGDLDFLERGLREAHDNGCYALFQVGDFGFLWPGDDRMREVEEAAVGYGMPLFWIDGNHDWHPEIRKRFPVTDHVAGKPGVFHVRRSCMVTVPGPGKSAMRICGLGGAPSIDQKSRTPGKSWWSEETITDEELNGISPHIMVDVFACHDAPAMPPGFKPIGRPDFDLSCANNMQSVRWAWQTLGHPVLIHGHWHKRYQKDGIIGLDCNSGPFPGTYIIVEKNEEGKVTVL